MNYNLQAQNGLLLRVAGQAQTPNFEPIELLVPPLAPPDTAAVACFLLKKHTCKVWAVHHAGGASFGLEPLPWGGRLRFGLCVSHNLLRSKLLSGGLRS